MDINWFPGHMAKSTREIEGYLKLCDCVLYVLDSRAVRSCFNPIFDKLINIPVVYVLNKSDTVPENETVKWIEKLSRNGNAAVSVEGTSSSCKKKLLVAIRAVTAITLQKQRDRGLNAHIRALVVGVPNTGKSTVINSLCAKARMVTGDRAGVTRTATWARVDDTLDILDTPGTLYPKITERKVGEHLAMIGSIKDEVLDLTELALSLIDELNSLDEDILKNRYGEKIENENGIETVAQRRGFKMRGNIPDTERAAMCIIDDFRKGRLGKIILERADD